jgi:hypothetical protein
MNKLILLPLLLQIVIGAAAADPTSGSNDPAEDSDLWSRTREGADAWWERSRESAGDWWQRGQEAADAAWQGTQGLLGNGEEPDHFGTVWREVLPTLEETLALQERQETLPEERWFGTDQRSNREAIEALLDEAVDILSTSGMTRYRERIRFLGGEIERARRDIADYRQRRVTAPSESLVQKTADDYAQAIAAREADIARYEADLEAVKGEFAAELKDMGIILEESQVDLLLSTVVGDNLVDLGIVFDNVKQVTAQLEQLVTESGEDLQSARRYYGMYVVLLRSLEEMHRQVEEAILGQYVPQIDGIIERARRLSAETQALQRRSPEKKELLAANLDAQRLTVEAAGIYRRYLTEQAQEVARARMQLAADIAAAWNTYETVRVSGELVALVRTSRQLIQGLLDRQVPPLRPFENREMQREFERLTAELRAAGRG